MDDDRDDIELPEDEPLTPEEELILEILDPLPVPSEAG